MNKIFSFFNIIEWVIESYKDLQEWLIVRAACKEPESIEAFANCDPELRVDFLSRIYTVINLQEELSENPNIYWPTILEKLKPINSVMIKLRISEFLVPDIKRISPTAFLIKLYPKFDFLNVKAFLWWLFRVFTIYFIAAITNKILHEFFDINLIQTLQNYLLEFWNFL